jgi:hypothetical protein
MELKGGGWGGFFLVVFGVESGLFNFPLGEWTVPQRVSNRTSLLSKMLWHPFTSLEEDDLL